MLDFNKLEENQKVNYVKNLLFNSDLTKALDVLLQYEKKDLKIINASIGFVKQCVSFDITLYPLPFILCACA